MRLFHVSEESDIRIFYPRRPKKPGDSDEALIWAIDDRRLPNYLTPRNCPRVTYHAGPETTPEDTARFFSSPSHPHVVAIEKGWFRLMLTTTLYCYQFNPSAFASIDESAGYYVSRKPQAPIGKLIIENLPEALFARNVELRVLPTLWELHDAVLTSTLRYSMCKMVNARAKREGDPRGSAP